MKPELFYLALTATMTGLFWVPYVLNRTLRAGLGGAMGTPAMGAAPVEAEWALRAKRAHANGVENLVVFAALVLTAQLAGISNAITIFAAALYFWCRLAHYLLLTLAVPYLRTLVWTAAWVAQMLIAWQILAR
jgi:uncharacterized MAPEG superfamily protein